MPYASIIPTHSASLSNVQRSTGVRPSLEQRPQRPTQNASIGLANLGMRQHPSVDQQSKEARAKPLQSAAHLAKLTGIHAEKNGSSRISDEFVWAGHMGALEEASRKGNFAVSFRSAGKATLDALARGAAAKGHNILEKTIKKSSIEDAYGAEKAPGVLAAVKSAGIEGYVGHWNSAGLVGIYLSGKDEHDKPIYPIHIKDLESSLAPLKSKANWPTIPFTGDYDMHDLITFRGAGPPRTVLTDSPEEQHIIDLMNRQVAEIDPNRPFDVKQRNVVRHGPQVNFLSHMVASESEVVAKSGGVLGAVARPGAFPVAMLDRGKWTVLENIKQLDSYYSSVGARIKESWKPDGVRYFKDEKIVNLARTPYHSR